MPDSPIFARDDCDTFPSAAKAGAQEREAKNAKTTRVFIEKCLSQVKVRGEAPGLKVPIAVPRLRRECANNYRLFGQPWDFLGKRDFLGKAAQTHNQLCPAKISPTKSAICLTFVLTLTNFRLSEANRWIDSACS
jgi:hypothetical protein